MVARPADEANRAGLVNPSAPSAAGRNLDHLPEEKPMYGKLLFVAGLGAGYLFGTSRGRRDYEKLRRRASQIWLDPRVQRAAKQATDAVEKNVPMGEKLTEAVDATTRSARVHAAPTGTAATGTAAL
jgi:hypothetical protein